MGPDVSWTLLFEQLPSDVAKSINQNDGRNCSNGRQIPDLSCHGQLTSTFAPVQDDHCRPIDHRVSLSTGDKTLLIVL